MRLTGHTTDLSIILSTVHFPKRLSAGKVFAGIFFIFSLLLLPSCTLYKSDARNKIATNEGNFVEGSSVASIPLLTSFGSNTNLNFSSDMPLSGLTPDLAQSYTCMTQLNTPNFLKEPNYVIETPYEHLGFTTFFNQGHSPFLIVYKLNEETQRHDFCRITFNLRSELRFRDIQNGVRVGVSIIQNNL